MRGKGSFVLLLGELIRITPAYAGKSSCLLRLSDKLWDHPRTCGEKIKQKFDNDVDKGSPPHMRGKVSLTGNQAAATRITPAYAGKRPR